MNVPKWMLQDRDHELYRCRTRNAGDARTGDGAHLVERAVRERLPVNERQHCSARETARRLASIGATMSLQ